MCAKSRSWKSLYFLKKRFLASCAEPIGLKILPFGRDMLSGTMVFGGASGNSKPRFSVNRVALADSTIHPFECGFPPERESMRRLTSWFAAACAELEGPAVLPFECWGMGRSPMVAQSPLAFGRARGGWKRELSAARAELEGPAVLPSEYWGMGRSPMVTRCVCPLAERGVAGRRNCRRRVPD